MDVLALILACSVYPDDAVVRAMVDLASQGNPHFVGDLTTLATFDQNASRPDAERIVAELQRQGGKPVVGLLGLPLSWAKRYGRNTSELYDGCVNLWVGTAVLSGHYEACVASHAAMITPPGKGHEKERVKRVAPPEAIRLCALRRFANDIGVDGYPEAVLRMVPHQRLLYSPAPAAPEYYTPVAAPYDDCRTGSRRRPFLTYYPQSRRTGPVLRPAPILD